MIDPTQSPGRADFSRERRRHALAAIRRSGVLRRVDPDAQLMYAIGALICDAAGSFSRADLDRAIADPSIVAAARELLRKAAA